MVRLLHALAQLPVEGKVALFMGKSGNHTFRVGIFLDFVKGGQAPHVLRAHMGVRRTCGEPNAIESAPTGVALNGSGHVQRR